MQTGIVFSKHESYRWHIRQRQPLPPRNNIILSLQKPVHQHRHAVAVVGRHRHFRCAQAAFARVGDSGAHTGSNGYADAQTNVNANGYPYTDSNFNANGISFAESHRDAVSTRADQILRIG